MARWPSWIGLKDPNRSADHAVRFGQARSQVVVEQDIIEFRLVHHLDTGFADTFFDKFRRIGPAVLEAAADFLDGGRFDEDRERIFAEVLLEVHAALDIHVKEDDLVLRPEAVDFRFERTVKNAFVHFFVLDESTGRDAATEFLFRYKIIGLPVLLRAARRTGGGRHRKGKAVKTLQQMIDNRRLARSGRGRNDYNFSHFS